MGLLTNLKDSISRVTDGLFTADEPKRIGIYGPPNAGKRPLANRIARDWTGDAVGPESHIPHETRRARRKENVEIERNGRKVTIDIVDTPGVTTKVDYKEFLDHDMDKDDAVRRSREATEGVAEAMHWLREDVDGVIYVLDSTTDPFTQVNTMLIRIIESQDLPAHSREQNGPPGVGRPEDRERLPTTRDDPAVRAGGREYGRSVHEDRGVLRLMPGPTPNVGGDDAPTTPMTGSDRSMI